MSKDIDITRLDLKLETLWRGRIALFRNSAWSTRKLSLPSSASAELSRRRYCGKLWLQSEKDDLVGLVREHSDGQYLDAEERTAMFPGIVDVLYIETAKEDVLRLDLGGFSVSSDSR